MRLLRLFVVFFFLLAMPAALLAEVPDLPESTSWYLHVDFDEMRSSDAGRHLYGWLQGEVFVEIDEELGFDVDKEADSITAWSAGADGVFAVISGDLSQMTRDRILAAGAATGSMDLLGSGSKAYYHIKGDAAPDDVDLDVASFEDGAWFSFAVPKKLIVASSEKGIQAMIANRGKTAGGKSAGALFVLRAERSFVQAGMRAGALGDSIGWNSNILRNAEQVGLLVADDKGKLAVEAQLRTTDKDMAESLASIVRGLISLQAFSDDLDEEVSTFLKNTRVDVDDRTLRLRISVDPELVVATLD